MFLLALGYVFLFITKDTMNYMSKIDYTIESAFSFSLYFLSCLCGVSIARVAVTFILSLSLLSSQLTASIHHYLTKAGLSTREADLIVSAIEVSVSKHLSSHYSNHSHHWCCMVTQLSIFSSSHLFYSLACHFIRSFLLMDVTATFESSIILLVSRFQLLYRKSWNLNVDCHFKLLTPQCTEHMPRGIFFRLLSSPSRW